MLYRDERDRGVQALERHSLEAHKVVDWFISFLLVKCVALLGRLSVHRPRTHLQDQHIVSRRIQDAVARQAVRRAGYQVSSSGATSFSNVAHHASSGHSRPLCSILLNGINKEAEAQAPLLESFSACLAAANELKERYVNFQSKFDHLQAETRVK